ncbi:MAG: DUF1365 domain-containing protein [Sulfurospirillum sp.]|nr:DUF1365 domain-containing protein [Sulfurospirillum sp.]
MSHCFWEGVISHTRVAPKKHAFSYKFFMLDIDTSNFASLQNTFFSLNKINLFSFCAKDHFGTSDDFLKNIDQVLQYFAITQKYTQIRFITLPSIFGFVFNPISLLLLCKDNKPELLLAEVHNYHQGRVFYKVSLQEKDDRKFTGIAQKQMFVSPFMKDDGSYEFTLTYDTNEQFKLHITLKEEGETVLVTYFKAQKKNYSIKSIKELFFSHTLLSFWVVTRTLLQTFKLYMKGLPWHNPTPKDRIKRI